MFFEFEEEEGLDNKRFKSEGEEVAKYEHENIFWDYNCWF